MQNGHREVARLIAVRQNPLIIRRYQYTPMRYSAFICIRNEHGVS